jgi:hypothetical protein
MERFQALCDVQHIDITAKTNTTHDVYVAQLFPGPANLNFGPRGSEIPDVSNDRHYFPGISTATVQRIANYLDLKLPPPSIEASCGPSIIPKHISKVPFTFTD